MKGKAGNLNKRLYIKRKLKDGKKLTKRLMAETVLGKVTACVGPNYTYQFTFLTYLLTHLITYLPNELPTCTDHKRSHYKKH